MATAIITGASQGIGACIAKRLAKDGFDVAINHYPSDGDKEKALAVAEECRAFGVKAECYRGRRFKVRPVRGYGEAGKG